MNSPMREAGPSQTPGRRFREDPFPPPRAPGDWAGGPAGQPPDGPPGQPPGGAGTPPGGTEGLVRASGVMAAGTLASRMTGFIRTAVIAYALGTLALADAYNNANTFPNAVFDLLLGGILTSVFVPLLVNAAKRDADGGRAYDQRMFTLVTIALAVITIVATLAAPVLVTIYASAVHGQERALMVTFARFFIPQIFFYGISALAGAILNARGRFAAPMWTPVVNNIVVIFVVVIYMITAGTGVRVSTITPGEVRLLGIGTTLGIIAQAAAMIPALRRVGFRWRPQLGLSRAEAAEIGRMAGWMFGYIVTTQVGLIVTQNLANDAATRALAAKVGYGAGFSAYQYAWLLFQLPYAIVGISVITALLPRMSAHAADARYALVRQDFSAGVRLASVITVPAAVVLAVLAPPLAILLLGHGSTSVSDATFVGEVFAVFSLGLVPYMLFQLLLRVFYAMHDSRTTAFIGLAVMVVNIAVNVAAWALLPLGQITAGLAAGFGVANVAGTAIAWRILRTRTGGLDGKRIAWTLVRTLLASLPAVIFAIAMTMTVGVVFHPGPVNGFLTAVLGGGGAVLMYLLFARALGVSELTDLAGTITARFRGGRGEPG
ncbi:MAG TPA: murein biosynthesis integral membrane protein MurJ [Streptosporangiaceae bacterium]|nr:murein biosynthesis integral membrane protein MurJ [Streptosporangiaceae bacterium]